MKTQIANSSSPLLRQALRRLLLPAGALGMPALAMAGGPTGEVIVDGNAGVSRPDTNTTVIDQASWRAIIDWQSFNVGANEYVIFNQPGTSAVILNRVVGGDPTSILGSMTANGQVFLVNPQGVFFGQSATLDVGGLLATTLDISNADFMAGDYHFTKTAGAPDAGVVNEGSINADGGYVVLAADHVSNSGVVAARAGHVVMAAGSAFTLDIEGDGLVNFAVDEAALSEMAGVSNAGTILADGGMVLMTAKVANDLVATAVNNEGLIQAHSITEQDGVIYLAAAGGDIVNAGTLDADGNNADAGTIIAYSDRDITLADGAIQTAAADNTHEAGTIRAIAEGHLDFQYGNTMRATAGLGDGFIEVSGHSSIALRGLVEMNSGTYLIDPSNINIVQGSGTGSVGTIGINLITTQLNNNNNVVLAASSSITANSSVSSLNASGTGNLTIGIGTMTAGTGTGAGCLGLNSSMCFGPNPTFTPGTGGTINLAGLNINIGGDFNATAQTGRVRLGNVTTTGGAINIIGGLEINVGSLDAAGNITLDATGTAFTTTDAGITVNGNVDAGGGSVTMHAYGNSTESGYGGGTVDVTGNIHAANNVTIEARSVNFNDQINISGSISAGGNVQLFGSSTSINDGVGIAAGDITGTAISISNTRNLQAGRLTAVNDVTITGDGNAFMQIDDGSTGSIAISAGGNVNISGAGTLRLGHGTFGDGDWFGQEVNAGGDITINAGRVYSGAMTATGGNITINASSGQIFFGSAVSGSTSQTFTYADISAGGVVQLTANINDPFSTAQVQVNNVTGTTVDILANNTASYGGGALIHASNVTATAGSVRLQAQHGAGDNAVSIDAGKIIAQTTVTVEAFAGAGASIGGHITTGAISGEEIYIHHNGNKADISIGSITAINTDGRALVDVFTSDDFGITQAGNITINGDITVAGQVGNCTSLGGCLGAFNQPIAAHAQLTAGGSSSVAGGVVTVTGNVNITATAANVTATKNGDGFLTSVTGTAGLAELFIQGASADISGSLMVKGADALVQVQADHVSFGTVQITGTGHDITLFADPDTTTTGSSLTSSNNAGNAMLRIVGLGTGSGETPATSVTLGAVTINGIGEAGLYIAAQNTTLGSVAVSAGAATYNRTITGNYTDSEGEFNNAAFHNNGDGPIEIDEGTLTVGLANIHLATSGSSTQITINGDLSATGVGIANIFVAATDLTITGGVTATAAAGNMNGTGNFTQLGDASGNPSSSGSVLYNIDVTQQGSFGSAHVNLLADSGSIGVGGDITVSGLVGGLDVTTKDTGTINLHGISVTGTGGVLNTSKEITVISGTGVSYDTSFEGPTERTLVGIFSEQVTINGNVDVTGAGVAGLYIAGFLAAPVINGDVSVTATSATVTELDTRDSPTATTVTYGDAAVILGQFDSNEMVIAPADINGSLTLTAARDAHLLMSADIRDELIVNADRHIDTVLPSVFEDPEDPDALPEVTLDVMAGSLSFTAGGDILLSGTTLDIGSGSAGVPADSAVAIGASIGASPVNGAFIAGGTLNLGNLNLSGNYLWLEANTFGTLGTITLPNTALVQFTTFDPTRTLGLDAGTGGTAQTTLTEAYVSAFNGANYLAIGDSAHTGDLLLGETGPVNLATEQLIFATTGNIIGTNTVSATKVNFLTGAISNITANLNTGIANVVAGNDVGLTLSGPAIFTFGSGATYGDISLVTAGDLTLQSGLTATEILLQADSGGVVLGANTLTATNGIILDVDTTFSGTGLLTANSLNLLGATSTDFNILANVANFNITGGNDIAIDNTARTGTATLTFGTGPFGLFAGNFGGAVIQSGSFAGTGFDLTAAGDFNFGGNDINAGSGLITLDIDGAQATGTGLLTATTLTLAGGSSTNFNVLSNVATLDVQSGNDITIDNSANATSATVTFGVGPFGIVDITSGGSLLLDSVLSATDITLHGSTGLDLGANTLTATNGILLDTGGTFTGTGLLTANALTLAGGATTNFNVTTNADTITAQSGNDITIDNTANTGAATLTFGASPFGLFAGNFGGSVNLTSSFAGTGFTLTTPEAFTYSANTVNAGSGVIDLTLGGAATGSGVFTASYFNLTGETNTDYAFNTSAAWINIYNAGGITMDNTAHTGSAYVFFGSDTFTDVALTMGGNTNIGVANSLTANNATIVVNNGSLDISNHTFDIANNLGLSADNNIFVAGATITTGNLLMVAGSDITDSSGGQGATKQGAQSMAASAPASITADAMTLLAGGDILLGSTTFAIGSGDMSTLTGIMGDLELLTKLSEKDIAPPGNAPNATMIANGTAQLGAMSVAGGYLYVEAHDVGLNGAITGPTNLLVQLVPFGGIGTINLENTAGTTDTINLGATDVGLIQDGATLALGSTGYEGNVTLGLNGAVDVGARNFVVATTGTVDSLANITSTGLVANLEEVANGPDVFEEPTMDEIDADYATGGQPDDDEEGEEEGEDTDDDGVPDTEGDNALIEHDSSGETKVCAG